MFYFSGTRKPDFKVVDYSSDIYESYWRDRGFRLRDKLMEREQIFFNWIRPNSRVLSIGCGNSRLLFELKNQKHCAVYGMDIASEVVDGLLRYGINAVRADIAKYDFDLSSYFRKEADYIVLSEILEHLANPERLLQKVRSQSDLFIMSVPNSAFYRYRLGLLFNGRFFTQWAKHPAEHLRFWSHIDFMDWLEALDFQIIRTESSNGPVFKNIWPNMFGHQICYFVKKVERIVSNNL